mmetsp:Transcript_5733/g.13762  ORF Transcript_5733/g.13762 Transcript_5733/m.13762 type:complete len:223 (+) Transcript_5733:1655-2323(+)
MHRRRGVMTPAARTTSRAATFLPSLVPSAPATAPFWPAAAESPAAMEPRIHNACSWTSRLGLDRRLMSVGMASAWRRRRCWLDGLRGGGMVLRLALAAGPALPVRPARPGRAAVPGVMPGMGVPGGMRPAPDRMAAALERREPGGADASALVVAADAAALEALALAAAAAAMLAGSDDPDPASPAPSDDPVPPSCCCACACCCCCAASMAAASSPAAVVGPV